MTSLNNPKASSVAEPRREVPSFTPQISFSETRFSFAIPGRPANAYSLDQTVASIAAMMDGRRSILRCCHMGAEQNPINGDCDNFAPHEHSRACICVHFYGFD